MSGSTGLGAVGTFDDDVGSVWNWSLPAVVSPDADPNSTVTRPVTIPGCSATVKLDATARSPNPSPLKSPHVKDVAAAIEVRVRVWDVGSWVGWNTAGPKNTLGPVANPLD